MTTFGGAQRLGTKSCARNKRKKRHQVGRSNGRCFVEEEEHPDLVHDVHVTSRRDGLNSVGHNKRTCHWQTGALRRLRNSKHRLSYRTYLSKSLTWTKDVESVEVGARKFVTTSHQDSVVPNRRYWIEREKVGSGAPDRPWRGLIVYKGNGPGLSPCDLQFTLFLRVLRLQSNKELLDKHTTGKTLTFSKFWARKVTHWILNKTLHMLTFRTALSFIFKDLR